MFCLTYVTFFIAETLLSIQETYKNLIHIYHSAFLKIVSNSSKQAFSGYSCCVINSDTSYYAKLPHLSLLHRLLYIWRTSLGLKMYQTLLYKPAVFVSMDYFSVLVVKGAYSYVIFTIENNLKNHQKALVLIKKFNVMWIVV